MKAADRGSQSPANHHVHQIATPAGYLSQRALEGLKQYKYRSTGTTYLDVLHTPMWDFFVGQFPMWLAPNLITLTGLMCVVVAYLVNAFYLPDYEGHAPRWVYLVSALGVSLYVNLDCMDGKQARRTRTSSPLGQLFDHGCDALSVTLLLSNVHCSLDYPCNFTSAAIITGVMVPWLLAHWEEYHRGILLYGNGLIGVLEVNYALAIASFLSFVFGVDMWSIRVDSFLPVPFELNIRQVFFAATVIGCIHQAGGTLYNVLTFNPADLPEEEQGHKQLGWKARMTHLVYILVMAALGLWWTSDSQVAHGQCRAAWFTFGVVYALLASQLIMAHMAKEPWQPFWWGFAILAAGAVNRQLRLVNPAFVAFALAAVAFSTYLHYVVSVINEICAFLGIRCLTIKKAQA